MGDRQTLLFFNPAPELSFVLASNQIKSNQIMSHRRLQDQAPSSTRYTTGGNGGEGKEYLSFSPLAAERTGYLITHLNYPGPGFSFRLAKITIGDWGGLRASGEGMGGGGRLLSD